MTLSSVTVYVPTPLRRLSGGSSHVSIQITSGETTLRQLVDALDLTCPGLRDEVWEGADFKRHVNVYVNGDEVHGLAGTDTVLKAGDQVAFVPMMAGGADETLVIPDALYQEMVEHARGEYPNECCGLLSGKGSEVTRVHTMRNVEASPVVYLMDPKEQLEVYDAIDSAGEEMLAIYHSHTHSQAYPSATDVRLAYYPDTIYLIVSLADQAKPVARAFRIVDGNVAELEVAVR